MSISNIPGRRISSGDAFYTDWGSRGGDAMLVRIELIDEDSGEAASVQVEVDTREEPGVGLVQGVAPTVPSTPPMKIEAPGIVTGLWAAGTLKGQVRLKVSCTGGSAGTTYAVVRIFPPVFFDAAK